MAGLLTASASPATGQDAVAAELRLWVAAPFDLEHGNCALSVLAYVSRATGQPAPAWARGFGRVGALKLMRRDAVFLEVADRAMAQMGCPATDCPQRGDVALVTLPDTGLTACIFAGRLWAARGNRAVVLTPGEAVRAWRVSCRRH